MAKDKPSGGGRKKSAKRATVPVSGAVSYQPKMSKADTRPAVDTHLGQRVKLADYRSTVTSLTPDERDLLIGQAMEILDKVYAHLPLKRALHANDPTHQKFAFLPFRVEEFYEPGGMAVPQTPVNHVRKYVVSWVSQSKSFF
ncbi:MAG: hypothetical protein ACHRXM_38105 [Isosphaerales bacterium]